MTRLLENMREANNQTIGLQEDICFKLADSHFQTLQAKFFLTSLDAYLSDYFCCVHVQELTPKAPE